MLQETEKKKVIEALKKNGFEVFFHSSSKVVFEEILELIPTKALIGRAGSVPCTELGIYI